MRRIIADSAARPVEMGLLSALAVMVLLFEVIPGSELGRLAARTFQDEMMGIDPGELYEIPPELPEEDPVDVNEIIASEIPDVVQPVQVMNVSTDTTGLVSAITVLNTQVEPDTPADQGIPQPGTFIPHSVAPVCTYRPMPEYPDMARQAGVEGRVILHVFISEAGEPAQIAIAQSSGLNSMDRAAEQAVRSTQWTPARRADGVPVGVWTSVIYDFVID